MSFGTNAPEGFVDNKSKISATCNSQDYFYDIVSGYATSLFTGDPVVTVANGYIERAAVGGAVCGVFKGVTYLSSTGELQFAPYWAGGTVTKDATVPANAYIIDDPFVVFTIQMGTTGAALAKAVRASIGKNANFSLGAGSTFSGKSGVFLDADTIAATATLNCKILSITPGFTAAMSLPPENALDQLYNNVNVTFNNHQYKGGTGTLGT